MNTRTKTDRAALVVTSGSAAASAAAVAQSFATWGIGGALVASPVAIAACAGAIDARVRRIPDGWVVGTLAPTAVMLAIAASDRELAQAAAAVAAGAVVFALPMLFVHLWSPAALGFGDVKLAAALGAAIGLVEPRLGLIALCVASGLTAAVGVAGRRRSLPLAPGLVVGAAVALVAGTLTEMEFAWP